DEQTHRQLMLVYARMGRRSEALNQYLLLRRALKEELRTLPLPETNELFRRIQMGQVPVDLRESWLEDRSASPSLRSADKAERSGEIGEAGTSVMEGDRAVQGDRVMEGDRAEQGDGTERGDRVMEGDRAEQGDLKGRPYPTRGGTGIPTAGT